MTATNNNSMLFDKNHICLFVIISVSFLASGCFSFSDNSGVNLMTPESTYETVQKAIANKNLNIYTKCFHVDEKLSDSKNLKVAAAFIFKNLKILNHRILDKPKIKKTECLLTVEEEVERLNGIRYKTKVVLNLIKINNEWKIIARQKNTSSKEGGRE